MRGNDLDDKSHGTLCAACSERGKTGLHLSPRVSERQSDSIVTLTRKTFHGVPRGPGCVRHASVRRRQRESLVRGYYTR